MAFGSVYPWGYQPLSAAAAVIGVVGLWRGRQRSLSSPLRLSLGLVAVAAGLQLIPIGPELLQTLSPSAIQIIRQRELAFAVNPSEHSISIDPARTRLGIALYLSFALLMLGVARNLDRRTAARLAGSVTVLGVIVALVGIIQNATYEGLIYGFWKPYQFSSPFGPFVNRNHYAGWMLMVFPLALGYAASIFSRVGYRPDQGVRGLLIRAINGTASRGILAALAALLMVLALVMTLSRSGILCSVAALIAFVLLASPLHSHSSTRKGLVLVALPLSLVLVATWSGIDRLSTAFANADSVSLGGRLLIWSDTWKVVRDFWLTGTGLNTYGVAMLFYQSVMPNQHLRESHNDYLQLAAEGGALLVVPTVTACLVFAWTVRRRMREDEGSIAWIRIGAATGLVAIALQSFVDFSLQMPGNAVMLATIAGVAIHDGSRR